MALTSLDLSWTSRILKFFCTFSDLLTAPQVDQLTRESLIAPDGLSTPFSEEFWDIWHISIKCTKQRLRQELGIPNCPRVSSVCLVFSLSPNTPRLQDCLRLSSSKQMAKICSALGVKYPLYFLRYPKWYCALQKSGDIGVKLLMSWVFVNALLLQVNLGICFHISLLQEPYGQGEASELKKLRLRMPYTHNNYHT